MFLFDLMTSALKQWLSFSLGMHISVWMSLGDHTFLNINTFSQENLMFYIQFTGKVKVLIFKKA